MLSIEKEPIIQPIISELTDSAQVKLYLKREDLIHPLVSGNKWRKLKYNLISARDNGYDRLLTFGGAYSNHIYATAAAAKATGFKCIGIIRGEEHQELNATLKFAKDQGMHLHYMDRATYRKKNDEGVIEALKNRFGDFYLIPEGGTNNLAIKGTMEMASENTSEFDYWGVSVGTGGTIAGLINGVDHKKEIIGFSALKGNFLQDEITQLLKNFGTSCSDNWWINSTYHFGGYAKTKPGLLEFMKSFEHQHQVLLDPIYTGKMMFGIFEMIKAGYFKKGSSILAIHTGGLQGRAGFGLPMSIGS